VNGLGRSHASLDEMTGEGDAGGAPVKRPAGRWWSRLFGRDDDTAAREQPMAQAPRPAAEAPTTAAPTPPPSTALPTEPSRPLSDIPALPFPVMADQPPPEPAPDSSLESTGRESALSDHREAVPGEHLDLLPYSAICHLEVHYRHTGAVQSATGFITRNGLIATSAHVIWHPDARIGHAERIVVRPGHPKVSGVERIAQRFFINESWGRDGFSSAFDYAAIWLPDHQELRKRFFCLDLCPPAAFKTVGPFTIAGYPGDADKKGRQWRQSGELQAQPDRSILYHRIWTSAGQSGSPMFLTKAVDKRILVVGVHSAAIGSVNAARQVTGPMIETFDRWAASAGTGV
jgi:V8-like Glu-specific endopeptidase